MSHHAKGLGEPTWQEGNPAPYVKFITLCTYELQTTLGRIGYTNGGYGWTPSPWGEAAEDVLKAVMHEQENVVVEEYAIMPNHIHLLTRFKRQYPKAAADFVNPLKKRLSGEMKARRPYEGPIWEKTCTAHAIEMKYTEQVLKEYLRIHYIRWKYDSLYRPYEDPFAEKEEEPDTRWWY